MGTIVADIVSTNVIASQASQDPVRRAQSENGTKLSNKVRINNLVHTEKPHHLQHVKDIASTVEREVNICVLVGIVLLVIGTAILVNPLVALVVLTLCGVQLVYTHVWLIATILAITTNHLEYAGLLTAMSVAITIPWYTTLIVCWKDDIVGRVICGWGRWIIEDIFGCRCEGSNDLNLVPRLLRVGYHLVDLAVHFWPTPWLLQRYQVTATDCFYAFFVARLWSVSTSALHLTIDWTLLRSPRKLRVLRIRSQSITPFVLDGVVNDIYGLRPTLPRRCLCFLYTIEAVVLLLVAVWPPPSGMFLSVEGAIVTCASVGIICVLLGVLNIAIRVTPKKID